MSSHIVETTNDRLFLLLIVYRKGLLSSGLEKKLKTYDTNLIVSEIMFDNVSQYDHIFMIDPPPQAYHTLIEKPHKACTLVFSHSTRDAQQAHNTLKKSATNKDKVAFISTARAYYEEDIDSLTWFAFSPNNDNILTIRRPLDKQRKPKDPTPSAHPRKKPLSPAQIIAITSLCLFLLVHILFIPPLAMASISLYRGYQAFQQQDDTRAETYIKRSENTIIIAKGLYAFTRSTLLIFSLAKPIDNIFQIVETSQQITLQAIEMRQQGREILPLIMKQNKTRAESAQVEHTIESLMEHINQTETLITFLYQKLPNWHEEIVHVKKQLNETTTVFQFINQLYPSLHSLLGKEGDKTYLLIFANNMEIRPGGGFIGSFGIMQVGQYAVKDIQVYDVYDADGQLEAHVEPPKPISEHLNQPHWFLRDSAFSPDYIENYQYAEFFLEKEMDIQDLDGAILFTTTAIEHLIEAMGEVYVPDFQEVVTKDNFYIKTQSYAELGFFPGSTQKKRFLGSLLNQMIVNIENAPIPALAKAVKRSLDEKQMVIYVEDTQAQDVFDNAYWSGRLIVPKCNASQTPCISDYLMTVDANLGVNKANFFIHRSQSLRVSVDEDGSIENQYDVTIYNDSARDIFPGGRYKNYFQILLPLNARVISVKQDGRTVKDIDRTKDKHQTIGFLTIVPPKGSVEISVRYDLTEPLKKGQNTYQLVVQKQIGSPNSDFSISFSFPDNMYVMRQNISPLVNNRTLIYNTIIDSDKIFTFDLYRE